MHRLYNNFYRKMDTCEIRSSFFLSKKLTKKKYTQIPIQVKYNHGNARNLKETHFPYKAIHRDGLVSDAHRKWSGRHFDRGLIVCFYSKFESNYESLRSKSNSFGPGPKITNNSDPIQRDRLFLRLRQTECQ